MSSRNMRDSKDCRRRVAGSTQLRTLIRCLQAFSLNFQTALVEQKAWKSIWAILTRSQNSANMAKSIMMRQKESWHTCPDYHPNTTICRIQDSPLSNWWTTLKSTSTTWSNAPHWLQTFSTFAISLLTLRKSQKTSKSKNQQSTPPEELAVTLLLFRIGLVLIWKEITAP